MVAVDSRRISIAPDTDVVLDPIPVQMATTAVESLCPPVVTQTRPKEGCDPASPRRLRRGRDVLMEDSMVAMDTRRISIAQDTDIVSGIYVMPDCIPAVDDDAAPDVLSSGREPAGGSSEIGSDVCMVPDLLPTAVFMRMVVAEMCMERFVLVPEACPVVSMTSTVAWTFGPALSEEYSPVVLAGGRLLRHTAWSW